MNRPFAFFPVCLITILVASNAWAQTSPSIVVQVKGERGEFLANRICHELRALGMDAYPAESGEIHSEKSTENVAVGSQAGAAISVELSKGVVDVWVADRITGKNLHRASKIEVSDQPEDTVVVVTAVELLRASFMEIHGPQTLDGDIDPSEEIEDFAAAKKKKHLAPTDPVATSFHMTLGPSLAAPSFDMSPSLGLAASVFVRLRGKVDVGAVGVVPIIASSTDVSEGHVKVSPGLVGGELALPFGSSKSKLNFRVGAGLGAALFNLRGVPEDGYVGYEVLKSTAAFFGTGSMGVRLSKRVVLRFDYMFAWAVIGHVVLAGEDEVASLGRPWMSGAVLIDMAVF